MPTFCRRATAAERPAEVPRLPAGGAARPARRASRHLQTESWDWAELLARPGEAGQAGHQQAQGAEDQAGGEQLAHPHHPPPHQQNDYEDDHDLFSAMELALFNRDLETIGRRDQEGWQVIVFFLSLSSSSSASSSVSSSSSSSHHHYHYHVHDIHDDVHRDHAAMAEIYSGNIMVSLYHQSNTVFNFSINNNWNENIIVLTSFNHPVNNSINSRLSENFMVNNCRCGVRHSTTTSLAFTKSVARSALRSTKRFLSSLYLIVCVWLQSLKCNQIVVYQLINLPKLTGVDNFALHWQIIWVITSWSICWKYRMINLWQWASKRLLVD